MKKIKEKFKNYLNKIKNKIIKVVDGSSSFKSEPPASVIKMISKLHIYSFLLFIISIPLLIAKIISSIIGVYLPIYYGLIYTLMLLAFAFYILKRIYIKSYNEDKFEVVNALILSKKINKLTRKRSVVFQTNSGVEREIIIPKKVKIKKGGIYEFCIRKPTDEQDEQLLYALFIKYKEEDLDNQENENIIEEE